MKKAGFFLIFVLQIICVAGFSQNVPDTGNIKLRLKVTYINGQRARTEYLPALDIDYDSLVFYIWNKKIDSSICYYTNPILKGKYQVHDFIDNHGYKHSTSIVEGVKTYERITYGAGKFNFEDFWYKKNKLYRKESYKAGYRIITTWDEKGNKNVEKVKIKKTVPTGVHN